MFEQKLKTIMGEVSVTIDEAESNEIIVFLHGIYLDKSLWEDYGHKLTGRTHIYVDMPAHGKSSDVGFDWNMDDCVRMLMEVLNRFSTQRCILIGHCWGSMTALRAAVSFPERFEALGLFNMPHKPMSGMRKMLVTLQKRTLKYPQVFAQQAAKTLYSAEYLEMHPEASEQMMARINARPVQEIARIIDGVLLNVEDAAPLINDLRVPALAIIGASDYVGPPPGIETLVVASGHVSPEEAKAESRAAIFKVLDLA